ncbi:MAG: hypothetical protein GEU83_10800 [Pseudonocardiaceae bacterium]|nr:hypothetical protein [Pseudonocardiaceae bacterium]
MTTSCEFGIPGVRLTERDHICAFYRGPQQRDEILVPYLSAGLQAGDMCICVVDGTTPQAVLAALGDEADVNRWVEREQLEVRTSDDAYLSTGRFVPDEMLAFWEGLVGRALGVGGFHFARAVGEMTWALREAPGVEHLVSYESELNRYLRRYPQVLLCLYDLDQFTGDIVIDLLKTHPRVLLSGMVLDNPYYLEPDEFLAMRSLAVSGQ